MTAITLAFNVIDSNWDCLALHSSSRDVIADCLNKRISIEMVAQLFRVAGRRALVEVVVWRAVLVVQVVVPLRMLKGAVVLQQLFASRNVAQSKHVASLHYMVSKSSYFNVIKMKRKKKPPDDTLRLPRC